VHHSVINSDLVLRRELNQVAVALFFKLFFPVGSLTHGPAFFCPDYFLDIKAINN